MNKDAILSAHRRSVARRLAIISVISLLAAAAFLESTVVGSSDVGWPELIGVLMDPAHSDARVHTIFFQLRIPMAVMALLVGLLLSLAGAQMQTILANPLAEPFTLGVSAAAACGGAIAIVLKWQLLDQPQFNIALTAWLFSLATVAIIVAVSLWRGVSAETMILLGIALTFLFQAVLALIQYRASTEALQQIVFWSLGSMTRANWTANVIMAVVLVLAIPFFWFLGWRLTALSLGDARAAALGVNVARLRVVVLIVVSLMAATTVAFCGIIGFIGLVGPHVARLLVGEDQRFFLPASLATGALLMSGAHTISLLILPGQALPIGIITALVGVPFFLFIILSSRRSLC